MLHCHVVISIAHLVTRSECLLAERAWSVARLPSRDAYARSFSFRLYIAQVVFAIYRETRSAYGEMASLSGRYCIAYNVRVFDI